MKQVKKYKLQHTNAFVSYNRENECLFGCKLMSRTTYSVREDKLCPPSLSKSSFACSNSSIRTQKKGFLGPGSRGRAPGQEVRLIGLGWPP